MLRQGEPEAMLMLPELRCTRSGLRCVARPTSLWRPAGFRTRRRLRLAVKRPVAEARRAVACAASDLRAVQRVARLEGRFIAYDATLHYALGAPLCTVVHRNMAFSRENGDGRVARSMQARSGAEAAMADGGTMPKTE